MPLEGFSLLAKPALRPRMVLRALRPPMILGASLPGMIFPAQRPAEGSNSYHYGSHATLSNRNGAGSGRYRFHTTMVLTQPRPTQAISFTLVSFPYHYGSHATGPQESCPTLGRSNVSIPLWFSRNCREACHSPHSRRGVSIPLWFLRNSAVRRGSRRRIDVSIPLWFLRNST